LWGVRDGEEELAGTPIHHAHLRAFFLRREGGREGGRGAGREGGEMSDRPYFEAFFLGGGREGGWEGGMGMRDSKKNSRALPSIMHILKPSS